MSRKKEFGRIERKNAFSLIIMSSSSTSSSFSAAFNLSFSQKEMKTNEKKKLGMEKREAAAAAV